MRIKNILITGAAGFIGRQLVNKLEEYDVKIFQIDDLSQDPLIEPHDNLIKDNEKVSFNNTITNNGKNENHKDLRYNFELKKLFKRKIFIKYKVFRKINNLYQTYMMRSHNRKNSKKMKKYFE